MAIIDDLAGTRFEELGQQVENRGLTGAVWTDQRVDRAAPNLQVEIVHSSEAAKLLGQAACLED